MNAKQKFLESSHLDKLPARARWRKRVLIGFVIYSLIGFFVLPAVVKWQLRKQLPALTHRHAEVKQVRMNPYALSLTVRGLALTETNGTPFIGFDELYVNFQLSSLFRRAWTFGDIRLSHPTANLIRLTDGSFNFSNLISTNSPPNTNPPSGLPTILIQSLLVTNAVVAVADEAIPGRFQGEYGPINLTLTDFTTRPAEDGPYRFVATTGDGESFSWSGRISVNPPQSTGQFKFSGISPAKYSSYLAQFTTARIQSGKINLRASYRVNAATTPLELEVTNATVELRDFLIRPPGADVTLLELNQFMITNASASLTGHVARVGMAAFDGGSVLVGRETNGQPSLLNYLVPRTNAMITVANNNAASAAPPAAPWQIYLDELAITNFSVAVEDHSTPTIAELGIDQIAMNLKGLSNQTNAPIQLALNFAWRGGGVSKITAQGTLLPPDLTSTITIDNLALEPLQPYVGQHLNLTVHSGGLQVNGAAEFNPGAVPQIHFAGDVGITNFASSDTVAYHELASWRNLQVRGIDFTLQTNHLSIQEVKFTDARNNLAISSNGVLNVSALVKLPPPGADTNTANLHPEPRELFPIHVAALRLERNSFHVTDDSLPRRFETHVNEINGEIRDIVLPGLNKAGVELRGKVSALAPFEITGAVTPDPKHLFVDLKVAFTNTDLTSLGAYTEKFVGRPLNKGKLTTELRYHIENRALTAANLVTLDQLTFGARNNSPDATKLPVKLAVGLLKDVNGRIDLDLPITGSLDDPDFSIRGLVFGTLKNLVLKIAASPFSLLGALAGGGAELQYVEFDPGQARLGETQTNKLMKLAQALQKRPALSLEIGATYDAINDVGALGKQKLLERMKASFIEERVARGKTPPALSELNLDDAEYERLLRKAYQAAFKTTPELALREALLAASATNASGEINVAPPAAAASIEPQKGATILMNRGKSLTQLATQAQSAAAGTNTVSNAKPRTERELIRDELEQRLVATAPATSDELRALMEKRIEVVQQFLVEVAGISADRVIVAAPRPEEPNSKGEARVVFSLE